MANALSRREEGTEVVEYSAISIDEPAWLKGVKEMVRESSYFAELERKLGENKLNGEKYKKYNDIWFYKGRVLLDSQTLLCAWEILENHDTPSGGHSRTLH